LSDCGERDGIAEAFRIKTRLIFHNPAPKRARRRAKLARPRQSRGSAAAGGAPGAERESFSPLDSSRDGLKFSIPLLSLTLRRNTTLPNPNLLDFSQSRPKTRPAASFARQTPASPG
jgi:hypothetical protein